MPQTETKVISPPTHKTSERKEANQKGATDTNERYAEIEREQVSLLRKSDAFMESLLRHRAALTQPHEVEKNEAEARVSTRQEEPVEQKQTRLQPSPEPLTPEPAADRSSLVIGSLTVEVVPPTLPAPAAPRREVVIVRGAPNVRGSVPSSRRFGLGQF